MFVYAFGVFSGAEGGEESKNHKRGFAGRMFVYAFGVFSGAEGGEEKEEGKQRGGTVSRSPSLHTPPCFKRVVVIGEGNYAFGVFSGAEGGEEKEEGKQRGGTVSRSPSLHTPPCFKRVVVIGEGKGLEKEMALGFAEAK